ncbi:hypothetical protein QFZ28_000775 [Neobacillus niacini]|uniref:hypothetical protein n=1 Tax=Neobacillus niacini TaxID=86668 RepID=UPI00277F249B|nr:hypothetical protein [Neobacillus niacini]MDQ1000375.1 hypothetical protein [Neobacillus niacini]
MRRRNSVLLFIVITILSGCSGSSIPEDISKEYYKMFVESYELYEERVQRYNGQFVDDNGELIDFGEEGIFVDSSIMEAAWEDRKRKENGEEGILTEKEEQLKNDFIALYLIKQLDFMTEDLKQMLMNENPEYSDPLQAAINLEKKVIHTLKLGKKPVTASLITEDKVDPNGEGQKEFNEENQDRYQGVPKEEKGKGSTPEESPPIQENEPSSTEPEWDKEEYLFPILQNISDSLTQLRQINAAALSLDLNEARANQTLELLETYKIDLGYILDDPETNQFLNDKEFNKINHIIAEIDEVIHTEQVMINNPSTQNIRIAESVVEGAQGTIDAIVITGIF